MVTPKEKEVKKKEFGFPIKITKAPEAEMKLKMIPKTTKVREEAREAMSKTEKTATEVAKSFEKFYTETLSKTPEGKQFLANMKKNSEIGNLLFS